MNTKSRIASILKASSLDFSVTEWPTFDLSTLDLAIEPDFELPNNVRLRHLAENVVAELIKSSTNYKLLYENVQVMEGNQTIGELDFIVEDLVAKQTIHMELAYKFYLYDPNISLEPINNWIGPNRNDSLKKKLEKLKAKQFPLLYHNRTKSLLSNIEIDGVSQAMCFLVSLFVPYEYKTNFSPIYSKAIRGYYLNLETFTRLDHSTNSYHLPLKKEWGMEPAENQVWTDFDGVKEYISASIRNKQALLCWQKHDDLYKSFFIVWW